MKNKILYILILIGYNCIAQFAGPAGSVNSTAIHKDSIVFVNWASECTVIRGFQDIANTSLGVTNAGEDSLGTRKAGENGVVSLGDGGSAILRFPNYITNGPGFDFAVFENAFSNAFLELAFVEVSSDGINYFRFPPTSLTQYTTQISPWDELGNAALINNLAGKYKVNYGTPFDLQELENIPGLDINAITHVKIIDVVGSIIPTFARLDKFNHPINDPYPTAFGNGGFDLDAVGVIHEKPLSVNENKLNSFVNLFPNPCNEIITVSITKESKQPAQLEIMNNTGECVCKTTIVAGINTVNTSQLLPGVYFIKITDQNSSIIKKLTVSH